VQFPTTASDALTRLNASLPTLDQLRAQLDGLISIPFEAMRQDINSTIGNVTIDRALLPVPSAASVSLCGDLDTSVVDDIAAGLLQGIRIGLGLLFGLLALYLLIKLFFLQRTHRQRVELVEDARAGWLGRTDEPSSYAVHAFLDRVDHPLVHRLMDRWTPTRWGAGGRARVAWFVSYISWRPATLLLGVALVGLVVVQLQLIIVGVARSQADGKLTDVVGGFADRSTAAISAQMVRRVARV
jgi:hypothetical protein